MEKDQNMATGKGQKGGNSRLGSYSEAMNNKSTLFVSPSVTPLTARRVASVLVPLPLLGQDRLSSVVRTQLVSRCSCGRTGRPGRGNAGAGVWQMFSDSVARCFELQRCPGRRSASGGRTFHRGTSRRPASSPLSRSLEGSSI